MDITVKIVDLIVKNETLEFYYSYFDVLRKCIPEEKRGNFKNIGHNVLQNHMTTAIEINAMIWNDIFTADINYNKEAFKVSTMTSFADNYLKNLEEILEHIKNEDDVHFTP
jgi:non-ribosomal peptide synthase protein (TIGR01720 family)